MRYDLPLICDMCRELGLPARTVNELCVHVDLGYDAILVFENANADDDCYIGFLRTPWHGHGGLMFVDSRSHGIEVDYLDLIAGLKDGRILICEHEMDVQVADRWLIHSRDNDLFEYLHPNERMIVRRAATVEPPRSRD